MDIFPELQDRFYLATIALTADREMIPYRYPPIEIASRHDRRRAQINISSPRWPGARILIGVLDTELFV